VCPETVQKSSWLLYSLPRYRDSADIRFGHKLRALVARKQCAVLVATHSLDLVLGYSTRVMLLMDGKVSTHWASDALQDMRGDAGTLEAAMVRASEDLVS
jgi:energy-coupling factor transporter ATP-binding protein EcfA2